MTEQQSTPLDGSTQSPRVATASPPPGRSALGSFVSQLLLVCLVGAAGFGGGYLTKDRDELMARERLLQQQIADRHQIAELERELHQLELARAEAERQRATIVEVDLNDVFAPVREGVARAAVARFDALATDITDDLRRIVQVDLLNRFRADDSEVRASGTAPPSVSVPEGGSTLGAALTEPGDDVGRLERRALADPEDEPAPTDSLVPLSADPFTGLGLTVGPPPAVSTVGQAADTPAEARDPGGATRTAFIGPNR